jgi:peroxiredoxin
MRVARIVWFSAIVSVVAAGAVLLYPIVGIALANLACIVAAVATMRQNTPGVRLGYYASVVGLAVTLGFAARELYIPAAVLGFGLTLQANELVMRRWKAHHYQALGGFVIGLVFAVAGYAAGASILGIAPIALLSAVVAGANVLAALGGAHTLRRAGLEVGQTLPDFELPRRDGQGASFRLAAERGAHVLLVFVRGDWCPVCHVLMRIIVREAPLLRRHGVRVAIITPSGGTMAPGLRETLGLEVQILLDDGAHQARAFGLIERTRGEEDIPLPVALLVGPDGTLLDISCPDDVTAFTSESRIARILAKV